MNNDCVKADCEPPRNNKEFRVLATIKQDYWVEDIKRYVIPYMYFIPRDDHKLMEIENKIGLRKQYINDDILRKPFVSFTKKLEFNVYDRYVTGNVFDFDAFETVTITSKIV